MVVSMIEVNYNRRQDRWNNVHKGGYTYLIFLFIPLFWNSDDYFKWFLLPHWEASYSRQSSELQANMKLGPRIF